MKIRIASLLLREDVGTILKKIQSYQGETSDLKSRQKDLLQRKLKLNQLKSDLEKQHNDIDKQKAILDEEVKRKRGLKEVAEQIEQTRKEIDCKESDLQNINLDIVGLQNWLRNHSGDLTQLEGDIIKSIQALEEDNEPAEPPQDDILEEEEEYRTDHEEEITIKPNKKKEQDKSRQNVSVEPSTRKQRDHKIKEIFDIETGETIHAEEFFKKPIHELESWRAIFQQCISQNNRRFVCPKCFEMIRISGRGDERGVPAIFTHKNDSVLCEKTTTGQSEEDINRKKYGLFGQSQRHKNLKKELFDRLSDSNSLSLGVRNVEMEKRVYSSLPFFNWRQPDIQIDYQDYKIVFEIQLSTTFLSVITERDTFYRMNDYYIIWIFNFDDNRKYVDLNNLAMKDIYFANKLNAFIFDDEAREWSRESGQLVLKCNWVEPDSTWHYANTGKRFGGERVTLDKLKFDHDTHKLYYYDAETPYFEQHPDMAKRLSVEIKSKEDYIRGLEQNAQEKKTRRQEAIELMLKDGGCVIPFEEKKKFGFKYGATHVIEPHFTSCVSRTDGTFIVGFNRKEGIVSQNGEMIRECEYIKIHSLTGSAYLAEGRDSFWLGNMGRPFRERKAGDSVVCALLNKRVEKVSLYHRDEGEPFSSFYVIDGRKLFAHIDYETIFADLEGNKIVEEEFSKMRFILDKNLMHVQRKEDGKWNDLDYDGNYMHDWTIYEDIYQWSEGLQIGKVHTEGSWRQQERIYYDIIDAYGCIITGGYSFVGKLDNGIAKVVIEGKDAEIDSKGHLIPEQQMQLSDNIKALKLLGYWELVNREGTTILSRKDRILDVNQLFGDLIVVRQHNNSGLLNSNGIIIPCNHRSISLWAENIIKIGDYNCEYLVDVTGKRISPTYKQIGDIENGKAKIFSSNSTGYIDEKGQPISEMEIQLPNGSVKYLFMGKWGIRNSKGQTTLECSYDEITTYHGYYYVIVDRRITKTNWKTTNTIPVKGIKTMETDKTIVFNVGGKDFFVPRTIAIQYWKDNIPESAELVIKNFHKETYGRGWSRCSQLNVYAKPYCRQEKEPHTHREFAEHETVKGIISRVQYGSVIVKLADKSTIFVHRSSFRGLSLDKAYKGREIEIMKVGVNEEHHKDVWEIVRIGQEPSI